MRIVTSNRHSTDRIAATIWLTALAWSTLMTAR